MYHAWRDAKLLTWMERELDEKGYSGKRGYNGVITRS